LGDGSEEELKVAEAAAAAAAEAKRPSTNGGTALAAATAALDSLTDEQLLQHYYNQRRELERVQSMEKENLTLKKIVDELRRRLDNHIAGEREHSRHLKGVALRRKKEKHELKVGTLFHSNVAISLHCCLILGICCRYIA
jgi:hypothetical protein